jgi:hypothetical protein
MNFQCQRCPRLPPNEFLSSSLPEISEFYIICSCFRNSAFQPLPPFPMPSSSTRRSPSIISTASSTTQAAKKAVKSFKKAVKNGAAAIARPFKKRRTSSGSGTPAAGDSGMHLSLSCLPTSADRCILVGGGSSTRPTSVVDSDEEVDLQAVEETPEQELSMFRRLEIPPSFQVLIHLHCRTFAKNLAITCLRLLQERHQDRYRQRPKVPFLQVCRQTMQSQGRWRSPLSRLAGPCWHFKPKDSCREVLRGRCS